MRLIDADDLIAYLNDYARQETSYSDEDNADIRDVIQECIEAVEEQPTAYDIDKVVERLKEEADMAISRIGESMIEIPLYKGVPTMRNYEDYIDEYNYTKGWNDAMDFIFPEAKEKREKERIKKNISIIK